MSDLRPLLEEDATSVEAEILRQARAREPSAGAAGRALVALGIAGAATTATAGAADREMGGRRRSFCNCTDRRRSARDRRVHEVGSSRAIGARRVAAGS